LQVEVIAMPSGVQGINALIAGEVAFVQIAGGTTAGAAVGGADVKIVATTVGTLLLNLVVRPEIEKSEQLRTFKAERAYENDPLLGTDPQPKHLKNKYTGSGDNGGVHINSGIPNHAFYLAAMEIGGKAWERMGQIWYKTMLKLTATSQFDDMVETSTESAATLYGNNSREHKAVTKAWKSVGF
jgi:Thermolysin metallopeptidase, alpha-helical domain